MDDSPLSTGDPSPPEAVDLDGDESRRIREALSEVYPEGLEGRGVLNLSCGGGERLPELKRLGAGSCLGVDVSAAAQHGALEIEHPYDITLFRGPFDRLPDWRAILAVATANTEWLMVVDTPTHVPDAPATIEEELRAAGFVLDARIGKTAVLDNRLRDGKFDMAFVEWRGLAGEDLTPVYGTGGALNFGRFSDPRVDEALAGLRQAWDPAVRWSGMRRLGALLAETCPVVPLVAADPHGLINRRVSGVSVSGGWLVLRALKLVAADEAR
jgi:hypothetical protein